MAFNGREYEEYDCVFRRKSETSYVYTPVQLKEFVPNAGGRLSFNDELKKLKKYSSENLYVIFNYNDMSRLEFSEINVPRLNIAEIWVYGCISSNGSQDEWFMDGNRLKPQKERFFISINCLHLYHFPLRGTGRAVAQARGQGGARA